MNKPKYLAHFAAVLAAMIRGLPASAGDGSENHPAQRFQECQECPSITVIPAGHFTVTRKVAGDGRKDDDPEGLRKVRPEKEVDMPSAFGLGTYPVTRREYEAFVRDTRRTEWKGCYVQFQGVWVWDEANDWRHPGFAQTDLDPVVCVTRNDALDYVRWLNEKPRTPSTYDDAANPYRLPGWTEIEYATRAGTTTLYYWGDTARRDRANYGKANCLPCGPMKEGADRWLYTSPVGSFPPNPWGLYDMAGNVWQWVQVCRPKPGGSGSCVAEVLHGGSWLTHPEYLKTGEYSSADPRHANNQIGFRVARSLSASHP